MQPAGHGVDFLLVIVQAGDQQIGDLQPDPGLRAYIYQGVQHRVQLGPRHLAVKRLGKGLEVDIGGIHVTVEFPARFGADITGGHGHGPDAPLVAGLGDVDGIFMEDDRIVVGKGDGTAAAAQGRRGQVFGGSGIGQGIHLARFADIPILAELAGQIAAGCPERQYRGAGQKMIERLLLYGVNAEAAGTPVGCQHDLATLTGADKAQAALAVFEPAGPGAHVTLHAAIGQDVPVTGGK